MELDWNLIKEILENVEENSDGFTEEFTRLDSQDFEDRNERCQEYLRLRYHYKILIDNGLVDGRVHDFRYAAGPRPEYFLYTGLTLAGVQTLEAMRNDTLWNQIRDVAIGLGLDGLRAIPALAIGAITGIPIS